MTTNRELRNERDRQVLVQYHIAEEEKDPICTALGLNSRQFNLVLHRAHQRFKKLLTGSEKRRRSRDDGAASAAE